MFTQIRETLLKLSNIKSKKVLTESKNPVEEDCKGVEEEIKEDTIKTSKGKWVNKGDTGETHGTFKTKKEADAQRKAMFAQGYKVKEDLGSDIGEYQKWVDYDMKKYGKVSNNTFNKIKKAGLTIVKDDYGDWEVIAHKANTH